MISTLLLALPLSAPQAHDALPYPPRGAGAIEARVRASFDPHGEADHLNLPKGTSVFPEPPGTAPIPWTEPSSPLSATAGGPPNDDCSSALVIPGNVVDYSHTALTVAASADLCGAAESCEAGGAGTDASVWYEYTPDRDGRVTIDTLGSNYNTVLSVFDACGSFLPFGGCTSPNELACNDDYFFGTTSQVSLDVTGGSTYKVKVASHGAGSSGGFLDFDLYYAPANDLCESATEIVGVAFADSLLSTHNAGSDLCEPDESCEFNAVGTSNSVWYSFLAPCDGTLDLNTNGSSYDTVLSVWDGCGVWVGVDANCVMPTEVACDDDSGTGLDAQLLGVPVQAGTEYRIKVADYNLSAGGGYANFNFLFRPASPPVAELTTPADFDCVSLGVTSIEGTASAGAEDLAEWRLEVEPTGGGARVEIASSSLAVEDGTLASWDTTGLSAGHYFLHLTVTAACGSTSTSTRVVRVDTGFEQLELHAPGDSTIVGGLVCIDGTARDGCFASYLVEVAPAGTEAFTPVASGTSVKINEALAPGGWDSSGVADGDYTLRLSAVDTCGYTLEVLHAITVDNTPPTAELDGTLDCTFQYGSVVISGTVDDPNHVSWAVQRTDPGETDWVTLVSGSGPASGQLATLDLSALPRCAYTIRLVAWDGASVNCDDAHQSEDTLSLSNQFPPGSKQHSKL